MPSYVDIAGWVNSTNGATSIPVARGRKRTCPLAEIDANATATTFKRLRIGKPTAPAAVIGVQSENADLEVIDDPPCAPRSSSALPLLSNAPVLGRPSSTSSSKWSCSEDEESSSRRSGQSGSSKRSNRSGSPLKQSGERQSGLYPITYAAGDMNIPSKLPKAVQRLVKPLKGIARDIAVLPLASDTPAMREAIGSDDMEETLFHDHATGDAVPALEEVIELVEKTVACKSDGAFEFAWNCEVHYPLLEMARKSSRHKHTLRWHNITNASISPPSLVPDLREREKVQSRKVEFGLALQLPYSVKRHLAQQNLQLNQSDYGPVKYNPIAISIETKLPGEGGLDARAQVSTWAEAQIRRLRILLQQAGHPQWQDLPIPPLPLLFVQGSDWTFWCFEDYVGNGLLYEQGIEFGRTTSVLGTYKVIAGLQILMSWTTEVWWPWIEEHILKRLVGDVFMNLSK
ncbi:hypothetical protein Slin15195_G130550 [Septoria linicola]|uniref:PD-(D/E)XK nuclease-like domain-containing protein n=1 Tax=Septoria linicola TaxID=215465 RepID=A0A9Q9B9X3_9PEZI|nr:hypothetical protein Slin15195_G130550 [Septoria linicola]